MSYCQKYVGCVGALRENLCLLRVYSISMLLIFLGQLAMVGVGYYFGDQVRIFLENTFAPKVIENYRENDDFTNLVDTVQEYFECCGMSTDGYRWNGPLLYFDIIDQFYLCKLYNDYILYSYFEYVVYRQWTKNEYFCCHKPSSTHPRDCQKAFPDTYPSSKQWSGHTETCGVPHSCCRTNVNETIRNLQCGNTMQDDVSF